MTVRRTIAIVGAGRAGGALAAALAADGPFTIRLWDRDPARARRVARSAHAVAAGTLADALDGAALVLIAVTDDALERVARELARHWPARGPAVALHTGGAHPAARLAPLARLGVATGVFHPVASLLGPKSAARLRGAFATLSGAPRAVRAARAIARSLGLRVAIVDDGARPAVHAAAVLAAGDLVTLLGEAEALLSRAGLATPAARALLVSLARTALDNYADRGAAAGLTGPVARGDAATLAAHLAALDREAPGTASLHRALAAAGARRAAEAGRISRPALRRVLAALDPAAALPAVSAVRTLPSRRTR